MRSEATATQSQKLGSHEWTLNYRLLLVEGGGGINRQMEEESCRGEIGPRKKDPSA